MPRLTLRETMDHLLLVVQAGHPVVYITTHEEQRVNDYLAKLVRVVRRGNPNKHLLAWSAAAPLTEFALPAAPGSAEPPGRIDWLAETGFGTPVPHALRSHPHIASPNVALRQIRDANAVSFPDLANSLTVFLDLHPYLESRGPLVRELRTTASALRAYYDTHRRPNTGFSFKTVVIVGPAVTLDPELQRDVFVLDFPLPEADELRREVMRLTANGVLQLSPPTRTGDPTADQLPDLVAGAGRGLTLDAFRLALNGVAVRGGVLSADSIEAILYQKAKAINNPALEYTPHVNIELGGLEEIKLWVRARRDPARIASVRERFHLPPLRGVMLCGVSGGGKSMLAQMIAKEFNLALLRLDVGALFGAYVGESEQRTSEALKMAEVLAPVVLWLDEVEKAFSGIGAGAGDGGVAARVFGHFLTWLSEKKDSVFVVATANDFQHILKRFPEFGRKGRFDEIFWVDLPNQAARAEIFRYKLVPRFLDGYIPTELAEIRQLAAAEPSFPPGAPPRQIALPADDELARQAAALRLPPTGTGVRELLAFCHLLSAPTVSGNMTGAEIEHAVKECLYGIYNLPEGRRTGAEIGRLIVETVEAACRRAMYQAGTAQHADLLTLRALAQGNNWPMVGG